MADPKTVTDILGLGKAAEKGIDVAADFLKRILGPAANEAGEALADPIREFRKQRQERALNVVTVAAEIIDLSGQKTVPVPGRSLWPLLERSSVEENDDLRRVWSQMLANSASENSEREVQPAFVQILSELSPLDVQVLAWVAEHGSSGDGIWRLEPNVVADHFKLEAARLAVTKDNLQRLNLITRPVGIIAVRSSVDVDTGEYWGPMHVTSFGYAFMNACSKETLFQEGC